jgi:hypothetical protein
MMSFATIFCLVLLALCQARSSDRKSSRVLTSGGGTPDIRTDRLASDTFRDDVSLQTLERRLRKRKQTRYTIFAVESPAGHADINFESTIKFVKTSLDLISEFDHYPEIKFFVDRKHKHPQTTEELPYRYSLFSIDLARNRTSYNFERITDFIRTSSDFIHTERLEILVKSSSGKIIALDVDASETVENIKAKIHEKEGIPPSLQRLQYDGQLLQNERRLYDYNIRPDSTLDLTHGIDISIKVSPSLVINLRASPGDTVGSLKQKMLDLGGATLDRIKLTYGGEELVSDRCLSDYNIINGSVIQATVLTSSSTTGNTLVHSP